MSPPEASCSTPAGGRATRRRAGRRATCCRAASGRRPPRPPRAPARRCRTRPRPATPGNAARTGREGGCATPPAASDVVVLHQRGVRQPHPVVDAAAAAHRVLLQRAQPRAWSCGCRGLGARCPPRRRPRRGSVATPDRWQSRLSAVRSAVSSVRTGRWPSSTTSPAADPVAVAATRIDVRRPPRSKTSAATARPATTPCRPGTNVGGALQVGRDGRRAGDVDPAAEVLPRSRQGAVDQLGDRAGSSPASRRALMTVPAR